MPFLFGLSLCFSLAPRAGFEPATNRLTAGSQAKNLPNASYLRRPWWCGLSTSVDRIAIRCAAPALIVSCHEPSHFGSVEFRARWRYERSKLVCFRYEKVNERRGVS